MPENKKHHYVPRFYLKRFSESGKSIGLLNIPKGLTVENANLKNQCYRDYFYGKELSFEKILSVLESEFSKLFLLIDEYKCLPPPLSVEHQVLIYCLLLQKGRTKYAADALDEMQDKMMKSLYGEYIKKKKEINLDDYFIGVEDAGKYSARLHIQFYPIMMDLGYKLLNNLTKKDFITSDTPVVKINPLLSFFKHGSNTGLGSKGLIAVYPSSPKYTMIFYDKSVYRVGSDSKNVIELMSEKDIEQLNTLQAAACYKNVYFKVENFGAKALIKKSQRFRRKAKANILIFPQPDLPNGNKSEIMMNYGEDVLFLPSLSFLGIRKSAKAWKANIQNSKRILSGFIRNEALMEEQKCFNKEVKNGIYRP